MRTAAVGTEPSQAGLVLLIVGLMRSTSSAGQTRATATRSTTIVVRRKVSTVKAVDEVVSAVEREDLTGVRSR